jgi:hypothetical protein
MSGLSETASRRPFAPQMDEKKSHDPERRRYPRLKAKDCLVLQIFTRVFVVPQSAETAKHMCSGRA